MGLEHKNSMAEFNLTFDLVETIASTTDPKEFSDAVNCLMGIIPVVSGQNRKITAEEFFEYNLEAPNRRWCF